MIFLLNCPLTCFPSDNKLDAMPRRERIAVKKILKNDAKILALDWSNKHNVRFNRNRLLFKNPCLATLRIYLKPSKRLDVHNLSIKHFLDQLVYMGVVFDDSMKHIPKFTAEFAGYAKQDYAEFELKEL
jgi:hypothetical protein